MLGKHIGVALASALSAISCQGDYPIPATRCDQWCELTRQRLCEDSGPAECVMSCERAGLGSAQCQVEFEAALSCIQNTPPIRCDLYEARPCSDSIQLLSSCAERALHPNPPKCSKTLPLNQCSES